MKRLLILGGKFHRDGSPALLTRVDKVVGPVLKSGHVVGVQVVQLKMK